jgi:hypothetical protein
LLMNRVFVLAFGIGAGLQALPVLAVDLPTRKAGLWEMTIQRTGAKDKPAVMQQCVDAATDKQMQQLGQGVSKQMCSKNETRNEGGRLVTESTCQMGGSTIQSKGVVTGQFDSAYRIESRATYKPPLMNMSESNSVIDAKWLGPCKADQKPGDMMMPNGMKMNIADMQQHMQGAKK